MRRQFPIESYEEWEKYTDLVRVIEEGGINPEDTRVQIEQKADILINLLGRKLLRVKGGEFWPTEYCKPGRIGNTFKNEYDAAVKRLSDQRFLEFLASCATDGEEIVLGRRKYAVSKDGKAFQLTALP